MSSMAQHALSLPSSGDAQSLQQYKKQLGVPQSWTYVDAEYVSGIVNKEILQTVKEGEIMQERLWLISYAA